MFGRNPYENEPPDSFYDHQEVLYKEYLEDHDLADGEPWTFEKWVEIHYS